MTLTRYKLVLQSNLNSISRIEPYVNQIVSDFGINDEIYGNILIALTEAVNNAILHGNKEDKSKKVTIKLVSNNPKNQLVFQISDDGPGFNHNHIKKSTR